MYLEKPKDSPRWPPYGHSSATSSEIAANGCDGEQPHSERIRKKQRQQTVNVQQKKQHSCGVYHRSHLQIRQLLSYSQFRRMLPTHQRLSHRTFHNSPMASTIRTPTHQRPSPAGRPPIGGETTKPNQQPEVPAVAPVVTPVAKSKRSLEEEEGENGAKEKVSKENEHITMDVEEEKDSSDDANMNEAETAENTANKEDDDELAAKEKEANIEGATPGHPPTTSNLASKLNKKKHGLSTYGFRVSDNPRQNKSQPANSASNNATAKPGNKRSHYSHKTFVHIDMTLQAGEDDGLKVTTGVVEKLRALVTLLGTEIQGCAVLPLKANTSDTVWRKATDIPSRGFSAIMRYCAFTGDEEEILKFVPRKKSKKISGVLLLGSLAPIDDLIRPLRIDLCDLHNVNIEVKRLQVEHSVRDITFPLLPHTTDEDFVQEVVNETLNQALEEAHNNRQRGNFKEPFEPHQVLTNPGFPANTWEKWKKGQRPQGDAENKNQYHMEYEAKLRGPILEVWRPWKKLLRVKLGRKTFPLLGVRKGEKKSKQKAYIELCHIHTAAMECTSVVELTGIKNLDDSISVKLSDGEGEKKLSIRDLLMEYKTEDDNWVFQMVAPSGLGSYEATFANTSARERLAANVALHPATWVMMRMFDHHGVDPDDIGDFLAATFNKKDAIIAKTFGDYNTSGMIRLNEGALTTAEMEDDLLAEMRGETWIDMSVINGKEAEVTRGDRTNGILFDHDDDKTHGSLGTKEVGELGTEGVSDAFASRNAGLSGLRTRRAAMDTATTAANQAANASSDTPGAPSPDQQGGANE